MADSDHMTEHMANDVWPITAIFLSSMLERRLSHSLALHTYGLDPIISSSRASYCTLLPHSSMVNPFQRSKTKIDSDGEPA